VDLDELAKIGNENVESAERRSRADRTRSFDTMVGSDGMLRNDANATGTDTSDNAVRKRGAAGFAAGSAAAATISNPFSDDTVLFDVGDDDEAPSPKEFTYHEPSTRKSSATVEAVTPPTPASDDLIDLTTETAPTQAEADQAAQSSYSFTSAQDQEQLIPFDDDASAGTLTPRSERSQSIVPDDISVLGMQNDTDHDARSEVFSEGGFTDAGFSDFGGEERAGVMTPNSWTDVGSDDESEFGGVDGRLSQV
jgi:hypothetical protein